MTALTAIPVSATDGSTTDLSAHAGKVVKRYAPQTKPEDIAADIEALL